MASRSRRILPTVGLVLGGAYLLSGPATGCLPFDAVTLASTADFCFIFDCQNGILGGTIDPCTGTVGDQSGELPLFTDCPDFQAP